MNYQLLQKYLKDKFEVTIDKTNEPRTETITGLQEDFLTTNNLTADPKLTELLTRFYNSVEATITPDDKYYQLPAYEQLTANYFATNKNNLGIKNSSGIEEAIADQHYQLLDQIISDFQANLPKDQPKTPEEVPLFSQAAANLSTQAETINTRMATLISAENPPNTNDQGEYMKILKGILLKSAEGKKILTDIRKWLVNYQSLNDLEKKQLEQKFSAFDQINKTKLDTKKKDQEKEEEETTEKPTKEEIKNKEELLYFGGFIVLLAVVALLFSKKH